MSKDFAIRVTDLYKTFRIPQDKSTSLKSAALNVFKRKGYTELDAAMGINFEVKKGEFLGIIGRNGSGKSTMLKMLAGIYIPDKGKIEINGHLSPFLEVGVGFNPELTAHDNVYLSGTILGLTRKEIDEKYEEIVNFAELGEFMDQKVKNFSSGMQVRLAFSVAIQAHSEILLIDEVLAVGDTNFQGKCYKVFHDLKKQGRTIVFVTHAMEAVKEFCDRVILLKDGNIYKEGNPKDVIADYDRLNVVDEGAYTKANIWGNQKVKIHDINFLQNGKETNPKMLKKGKPFRVKFYCVNATDEEQPVNFALEIFKTNGIKCFGADTGIGTFAAGEEKAFSINFQDNSLIPDDYYFDYRLYGAKFEDIYQAASYATAFSVTGKSEASGISDLGFSWDKE